MSVLSNLYLAGRWGHSSVFGLCESGCQCSSFDVCQECREVQVFVYWEDCGDYFS